jgi:hypothetical protein
MNGCCFERLLLLLDKKLDLEAQLEAFDHLDRCEICRETIYQMSRDRDEASHLLRVPGRKKISAA